MTANRITITSSIIEPIYLCEACDKAYTASEPCCDKAEEIGSMEFYPRDCE